MRKIIKTFSFVLVLFTVYLAHPFSPDSKDVTIEQKEEIDFDAFDVRDYVPSRQMQAKYTMQLLDEGQEKMKERHFVPTGVSEYAQVQKVDDEVIGISFYKRSENELAGVRHTEWEPYGEAHTVLQNRSWAEEYFHYEISEYHYDITIEDTTYERCILTLQYDNTNNEMGSTHFCPQVGEVLSYVQIEESKPIYTTKLINISKSPIERDDLERLKKELH